MANALAVLSLVIAGVGHLLLIGLCFAGMPNSTPQQMRHIQLWMLGIAVVAVATIVGGVLLVRAGHPWWCAGVALASPIAMFIALFNLSD